MSYQLAQDIRQVAEQNDMALRELCKIVGISQGSLHNWTSGKHEPGQKKESKVRSKLSALSMPVTHDFTRVKVSDHSDENIIHLIEIIVKSGESYKTMLRSIRYLLQK